MKTLSYAVFLGALATFAVAEHSNGPTKQSGKTKRELASTVSVCTITNVTPEDVQKLIDEGAVACTLGKTKIPLTAKLLSHIKGQVFLQGDPCKATDPDAPPSPPGTGFDELLAAACTIEIQGQKKTQLKIGETVVAESAPSFGTVMEGLKVEANTLEQLAFSSVFNPYTCVPRRIHK